MTTAKMHGSLILVLALVATTSALDSQSSSPKVLVYEVSERKGEDPQIKLIKVTDINSIDNNDDKDDEDDLAIPAYRSENYNDDRKRNERQKLIDKVKALINRLDQLDEEESALGGDLTLQPQNEFNDGIPIQRAKSFQDLVDDAANEKRDNPKSIQTLLDIALGTSPKKVQSKKPLALDSIVLGNKKSSQSDSLSSQRSKASQSRSEKSGLALLEDLLSSQQRAKSSQATLDDLLASQSQQRDKSGQYLLGDLFSSSSQHQQRGKSSSSLVDDLIAASQQQAKSRQSLLDDLLSNSKQSSKSSGKSPKYVLLYPSGQVADNNANLLRSSDFDALVDERTLPPPSKVVYAKDYEYYNY